MQPASSRLTLTESADPATVNSLLAWGRERLEHGSPQAGREVVLLLKSVLELDEAALRAHPELAVNDSAAGRFRDWVRRRARGEPAAYILGEREFYGRPFFVDERVLIPRPETEHVIEAALACPLPANPLILDLGTGSGCLAITLAAEIPQARVVAVDRSVAALACAHANARRHRLTDRVALVASDWSAALDLRHFDLVVANPPYLTDVEWAESLPDVRHWEPRQALIADRSGLADYQVLAALLHGLQPGCAVVLEIGAGQGAEVSELFRPLLADVAIHQDLAGHDRVVVGIRKASATSATD